MAGADTTVRFLPGYPGPRNLDHGPGIWGPEPPTTVFVLYRLARRHSSDVLVLPIVEQGTFLLRTGISSTLSVPCCQNRYIPRCTVMESLPLLRYVKKANLGHHFPRHFHSTH